MLVTLLVERDYGRDACFEINNIEQIKGVARGKGKVGNLGYHDTLKVPVIENTAQSDFNMALLWRGYADGTLIGKRT